MHSFKYKKNNLFCEGVKVEEICKDFNTPFYLYSSKILINNYKLLHKRLNGINFLIAYSVKANSNLSVLKTLAKCGAGADVVSIGELKKALKAGISNNKIVYSGVGKRRDEIAFAIKNKIEGLSREDPNYLDKVNDFNATITNLETRKKSDVKSIYLSQKTTEEFQREVILKLLQNNDIEDILPFFPNFEQIMGPGFKLPEKKADGGRIGYKLGTKPEPMMAPVVEEKKQTGEVQDLSYTELRSRLPQEISNEIVMLLANSKQALLDFANIQTGEDIASFNQQYDVNLTLPQGA